MEQIRRKISQIVDFLKQFIKDQNYKPGPKSFTFLFFVVFSSILWFLTTLSQKYTHTIKYPIHYINVPENYTFINRTTNKLTLQIETVGYTLLYYNWTLMLKPLEIDFKNSSIQNMPGADSLGFFLQTNNITENINKQLGSTVLLKNAKPDTIYIELTPIIRKKVPIKLIYSSNLPKPFRIKPKPKLTPDSIYITGAQKILKKIKQVCTEKQNFDELENKTRSIPLEIIENVELSEKTVKLSAPIEKYTVGELIVALRVANCPDSLKIKAFPANVKVSYIVSLENFRKVNPKDFDFYLDYNDIQYSLSKKIPIHMGRISKLVDLQAINPRKVEFIIEYQ